MIEQFSKINGDPHSAEDTLYKSRCHPSILVDSEYKSKLTLFPPRNFFATRKHVCLSEIVVKKSPRSLCGTFPASPKRNQHLVCGLKYTA